MANTTACLGLCFFDNQLFYAVSNVQQASSMRHIGAVDFNFNVARALLDCNADHLQGLRSSIDKLKTRFKANRFRLLLYPKMECWATLPKLVYDNASERKAYINILMNGLERKKIYPAWHALSKDNFKLLQLRTDHTLKGMHKLTEGMSNVDFLSTFEVGQRWIDHVHPGGSFLTVTTFNDGLSVSSFILGKLRGATYLPFDDPEDLPYLWLQKARDLSWMQGLHEQIQVYGQQAYRIIEILEPFWDDAGTVTKMDTLDKMQIQAEENTYGFDLALAYPAIMLALG